MSTEPATVAEPRTDQGDAAGSDTDAGAGVATTPSSSLPTAPAPSKPPAPSPSSITTAPEAIGASPSALGPSSEAGPSRIVPHVAPPEPALSMEGVTSESAVGADRGAAEGAGTGGASGATGPGVAGVAPPAAPPIPSPGGANGADWSASLQGMIPTGQGRDAIMKQLEALSSSKAQRDRAQASVTPSQPPIPLPSTAASASGTTSSPIPQTTPSGPTVAPVSAAPPAPAHAPAPSPNPAPVPSASPAASQIPPSAPTPTAPTPTSSSTPRPAPSPLDPSRMPQLPTLANGQLDLSQLPAFAANFTPEQREMVLGMTKARVMQNQQNQSVQAQAVQGQGPASAPTPTSGDESGPRPGSRGGVQAAAAAPTPTTLAGPPGAVAGTPSTTGPPRATVQGSTPAMPVRPFRPPLPGLQMPARPGAPTAPGQAPAPGPGGRPVRTLEDQRTQFLQTYISYHKGKGLPLHPEVMSGVRPGVIRIGETGASFELMELFLAFMRAAKPFEEQMRENASPPILNVFAQHKGIPNPLPQPVRLPQPINATESPQETTDPVQFLIAAFRVYLGGYDHHMTSMRAASMRQNQAMAQAQAQAQGQARPPNPQQSGMQMRPPPINVNVNGMASVQPPAPSPVQPNTPAQGTPMQAVPPHLNSPANMGTPSPPTSSGRGRPPKPKNKPTPINTQVPPGTAGMGSATPASAAGAKVAAGKKRKKGAADDTPVSAQPTSFAMPGSAHPFPHLQAQLPPAAPPPEPEPKRVRYKVEYRPMHMPSANLGGWDERAVASRFPKYNLAQPTRSIHDLAIVDMDVLLMGVRSRMPRELGYAITVLSMLSMAHPEEGFGGLPLAPIPELYDELLDLLAERAFGDEGLEGWKVAHARGEAGEEGDKGRVMFDELERMGRDHDWSFAASEYRESPDIVLALLNVLRNFSMVPDNAALLGRTVELIHLLAAISDTSLCVAYGGPGALFSVVELARAQRDTVAILANIGTGLDLRTCEPWAVRRIFRLLSSFLLPAWELLAERQSPYTPSASALATDRPPSVISITKALEAWYKLSMPDHNRQVLSRVPRSEIVGLYAALVRLLPVAPTQTRFLATHEEALSFAEALALGLYSLAFLASPAARAEMRAVPGAADVIMRIVLNAASPPLPPPPPAGTAPGAAAQAPPHHLAILGRRLAETLGVLNGTWTPSGDAGVSGAGNGADAEIQGQGQVRVQAQTQEALPSSGMTFAAGGVEGKGWTFRSRCVEPGWRAGSVSGREGVMPVLYGRGVEGVVWSELEGLIWGGGE